MSSVSIQIQAAEALAGIKELEKASQKVIDRTMADIRKRGPTWIGKGVAQEYNIKAGEVAGGKLVKMRVRGGSSDLEFKFSGRMLTPTHFNMTPKAPKPGAYTIKATIKKGQRATIGKVKKITKKQRQNIGRNFRRQGTRNSPESPPMLVSPKGLALPFQRTKQPGNFDKVIKTISVPQMIKDGDGNTKPAVRKQLNENIEKRFEHYASRLLG